ncbi:lactadherin-like [Acropora muricata]|uniref:lactadherin-like n=1 Tax=Acropora muricata TaxID=159855 RepID=UPI0034E5CAAF
MKFAVSLLLFFFLSRTTIVTSCTASYSVQGQALQNHIFKDETAEHLADCIALCTAYPGCHSSNFYRIEKRCELNDKTHASHPEDMVHVPYTIYMENIFRPMPCRNNLDCSRQMICSSSLICEECRIQPLGMENREIPNEAVNASSSHGSGLEPWQARLNNIQKSGSTGSWSARQNAIGQYLQIDLGKERVVNKIATQGRPSYDQWVTSYKLLFSSDGAKWNEYQNNGVVKVFTANSDRGTVVSHKLSPRISTRYVRFSVMSWYGHISMRVELYGCANEMNNKSMILQQLTTRKQEKSSKQKVVTKRMTGMNFSVTLLTIFLLLRTTFVTSCRASYSVQGQALQNHIFREETANRLVDCIALCTAHPGCHSSNFYRIEKRCELNDKTHASHPEDMVHVPYTIYMENIFRSCRNNLNCEECHIQPLGMESREIPNEAVKASSSWGSRWKPWQARLNNIRRGESTGSWSAQQNAIGEYLQIDLGKERVVNKIATQGRPSGDQWVTSYKLLFSSDGANWNEYQNNGVVKVFTANSDRGTIVSHMLSPRISSRYVRFSALSWHDHISMRVELYGCSNEP